MEDYRNEIYLLFFFSRFMIELEDQVYWNKLSEFSILIWKLRKRDSALENVYNIKIPFIKKKIDNFLNTY